jgi:hypothetical protein
MVDWIPHSSSLLYRKRREKRSPPVASSVITYLQKSQFWESLSPENDVHGLLRLKCCLDGENVWLDLSGLAG